MADQLMEVQDPYQVEREEENLHQVEAEAEAEAEEVQAVAEDVHL
jgi:hypothetical protein